MNVEQLKNVLKDIPNEYEVSLSINEEGDVLNHIFIDNDCGNVELTNFKDDETSNMPYFLDKFDNLITLKTRVLFVKKHTNISPGTVINITNYKNKYLSILKQYYKITILDKTDNKEYTTYIKKEDKTNTIIKYNW